MSGLRTTLSKDERGRQRLTLAGAIDESADLKALFATLGSPLVIDMGAVERINSVGVHRWIPEFTAFCKSHEVEIHALSYPLVLQANMVLGMFARAPVRSCLAPYFCTQCGENRMALVKRDEVGAKGEPPQRKCEVCKQPMSFDELDNYFLLFKA
jgi:hypothetical protein